MLHLKPCIWHVGAYGMWVHIASWEHMQQWCTAERPLNSQSIQHVSKAWGGPVSVYTAHHQSGTCSKVLKSRMTATYK